MRVLVTGASGMVGRALIRGLRAHGVDVGVYVRREDPELRALATNVIVGSAADAERLVIALENVRAVVHLVGGLLPRGVSYDWLNRQTTELVVRAARQASVKRIVLMSFPGADPRSGNEYLAAKGKAEELVFASELEYAIFRCPQILGPRGRLSSYLNRIRRLPVIPVPGTGHQRLNPIAVADVALALAAAATRVGELCGRWELGGPEVVTFDEFLDRAIGPRWKIHLRRIPGIPAVLTEVYGADALADPSEATREFELSLTPLAGAITAADA